MDAKGIFSYATLVYTCPHCGDEFPIFLGPRLWKRNGFLRMPHLACPRCEAVSAQCFSFKRAALFWPMAIFWLAIVISFARNHSLGNDFPVRIAVMVAAIVPFAILWRNGYILKRITSGDGAPIAKRSAIVFAAAILGVAGVYAYLCLDNPLTLVIGALTGMFVYAFFWFLAERHSGEKRA